MKKIFTLCCAFLLALANARADEGMWLLTLMQQQHLEDSLKKAGLLLPASELYSEDKPSLRECVGIFGGGCTGEVVSAEGLVLTNHHCGFSFVHQMSGIGHDYMKDGYFAHSRDEELRTPDDLTFTFVLRISDVTDAVNAAAQKMGVDDYMAMSQGFLEPIADTMLKASDLKKKKGVTARIVPYFGGNRFYIFYEQTFLDVRLVANPPYNVGQFGGNTDNWMWPRQNADFAMFRIYADKNGDPAPYSKKNVPLKVRKYLPISLKGMEKGDYTMVMGFPGTTSRYLTSAEVKMRCECLNDPIVLAGEPLLRFYKELMDKSDSLRLTVEDEYFSWGNTVKNFGGMNEAVKSIGLIEQKEEEEARFRAYAKQSGKPEYQDVIERIDSVCKANREVVYDLMLSRITLQDQGFSIPLTVAGAYQQALIQNKKKVIEEAKNLIRSYWSSEVKKVNLDIDKAKTKLLTPYYLKHHKVDLVPAYLEEGKDWEAFIDTVYSESVFTDSLKMEKALALNDYSVIERDPLMRQLNNISDATPIVEAMSYNTQRGELDKIYVRGLCEMYGWTKSPDANFTLRMTYGHVNDLRPNDSVDKGWRTVLDGMFEKESKTEGDYFVNEKLRALYKANDFGRYAREDGKLPACFLSDNDITGGNSGSPVLNAKGELIGLAFDGNIESLSSDLKYNPALQRCINVDIRYVLFIIDKFGGAKYAIDELDIR